MALVLVTIPARSLASEERRRTLTVTGEAIERIPTTITAVRLGVEIQGETADVQQQVAQRTTAVVELLRSRAVEQLQTSGIRLQPRYDRENNQPTGYVASNIVSFRADTEQVGTIIDEAIQAGATRIDGVSFTATEAAMTAAQRQALAQAVADAQQQAQAVLEALNLTSQEIISIQVNGANAPGPRLLEAESLARDVSTPVIGGEQEVRASVTLQVSY
ncbi:MAG: SIMPL domain-containing protein [Cyanophyceae cyanobacterium]